MLAEFENRGCKTKKRARELGANHAIRVHSSVPLPGQRQADLLTSSSLARFPRLLPVVDEDAHAHELGLDRVGRLEVALVRLGVGWA